MKRKYLLVTVIILIVIYIINIISTTNPKYNCDIYESVKMYGIQVSYKQKIKFLTTCGVSTDELNTKQIEKNINDAVNRVPRDTMTKYINILLNNLYGTNNKFSP